ncbi:Lecithin:cholesterol/phospholipid:diacylglycerol acyltransferase [Macleaya cordata]|uniref:Lecithin:cholesterol/phospholipid:diacylglycerol acyltransferase n=1 Tax=Macleaya cordata TaxID=56857 RepID=A0A200QDL6_MACCD|nr:Lecithin:cholesterol/phospholipid:diacylglycerol acyltransferase [Macleaya cordata]
MGDLCIDEEISTIPSTSQQIGFVPSDGCLFERQEIEDEHMVCCDAVRTTSFVTEQYAYLTFMDDVFFRLLNLTSCINHRFIQFIEDLVFRDFNKCSEDLVVSSSRQHPRSPCSSICSSVSDGCSTSSSEPSDAGASHSVCERSTNIKEIFPVYRNSEIVESNNGLGSVPYIFQGLMLPLFGLRLAWRLAFVWWKCTLFYVRRTQNRVRSLLSRIQRTLHGSSDDIGWLQRTQGMPPVEDGTTRFMELLQGIRNGEHTLPNSFVYLLIPAGLFSNHSPLYFVSTKRFFSKMGLACHIAKIHSEAAVEHNAWELKQYIEELYWGSGKRVMLLGHSKGGVDAAAALSIYWSELKDKVAGLALVQSPYGGSPIASDILREGQIADRETRRIMELVICKLIKGDMRALDDLTYDKRKEFITKHKLPEHIPLVSFHSEASVAPGVLATMSHIAHAELPWLPLPSFSSEESDAIQAGRKVPVIIPLAAAMAVSALHLQLRYGEKSDGLVTCRDAEVPGSVVVRPDRKLDHAWMVYSSWNKDCSEPDACEMCEALLTLLVEIGKMKQEQGTNP